MAFFVVTYIHPDGEGWNTFLDAHVSYLQQLLAEGTLRASGPFVGTPHRSAMLILSAPSREDARSIIEQDPYKIEGLVSDMTITEWNPIFGTYQVEASQPPTSN